MSEEHRCGVVAIAGRPNVGKSTLLNRLLGAKIAIVTPKPQTTRDTYHGIVNRAEGQIVFVDTPGIFQKTDRLSQSLNRLAEEQLEGVEAIVYVVDPTREPGAEEEQIQRTLRRVAIPIIMVINKLDLEPHQTPFLEAVRAFNVGQRATLEISALKHQDLNRLVDVLFELLPTGEAFYPEMQLTDMDSREWVAELIREKVFLRLREELPYAVSVVVDEDELLEQGVRHIAARIMTNEPRHKKIIIGARGASIKQIGTDARRELEAASGQKVFLDLQVEVDRDWQTRFS